MLSALLLTANGPYESQRSTYSRLAAYTQNARVLKGYRTEPTSLLSRGITAALRRAAFTNWYRLSSFQLEFCAWRVLRKFEGVVHVLWADRDLGFLDLIRDRSRHRLCCTFHSCPDTLTHNINFPKRLRKLDAVILMSRVQSDFFEKNGVPRQRIHVILHGVDTKFFLPGIDRSESGVFEVLSVGSYRRDFKLLRQICVRMNTESNVRFRIVARPAFRKIFADLPNVNFMSNLTDQQLLEVYRQASCFLLTAEAATANNALLEAMACGLPIVAETIGGIPEYVPADCGILVPPQRPELLVDAIRSLARAPADCARLAKNARRRAEELDWSCVARETLSVYRGIM